MDKSNQESVSSTRTGVQSTNNSYWNRFQIIDDVDDIDTDADDFPNGDSEDEHLDIDMKDMDTNIKRPDGYDEEMLNDEIEDIESDEDNAQIYAYQQMEQERRAAESKKIVVPGLSLGNIQGASYGAVKPGEPGFGVVKPVAPLGLNLGGVGNNKEQQKPVVKSLNLDMPRQQNPESNSKIPSLNIAQKVPPLGNLPENDQSSGRTSSKRLGIGGLNIGKAVAIQQQQLAKKEVSLEQARQQKIQDVEDDEFKPPQKARGGGGGMGLNLGGVSQPAAQNPSAQLSLNIANKPVDLPAR